MVKPAGVSSIDKFVKAHISLTNLQGFASFDEVWSEFFASPPPRTTVGTSGRAIKDASIDIDLTRMD